MDIKKLLGLKPVITGLIAMLGNSTVYAQELDEQTKSIPCLSLNRIQNVDILDNEHLVFQTGLKDYYLNTLPYACNGLRLHDSFTYSTSLNQICDVDVISVMGRTAEGYDTGPSCGLGKFVAIDKEQIEVLRQQLQAQ